MSRNADTVVELGTLVFRRGTTSRSGNELHLNSAERVGSVNISAHLIVAHLQMNSHPKLDFRPFRVHVAELCD